MINERSGDNFAGFAILDVGSILYDHFINNGFMKSSRYSGIKRGLISQIGGFGIRAILTEFHAAGSHDLPRTRESYNRLMRSLATPIWFEHIVAAYPDIIRVAKSTALQTEQANNVAAKIEDHISRLEGELNLPAGSDVLDIDPVGDVHVSGLCTLQITTTSGKKFLFKPSPPENVFFVAALTEQINEALEHPLYVPKTAYGCFNGHYQEYVENAERRRYGISDYYQFGAWLAIADALAFTDLHMENVISTSFGPCVIDYECFPTPDLVKKDLRNILPILNRTGILPSPFTLASDEDTVDWSALGGKANQVPPSWAMHEVCEDGLPTVHLGRVRKDRDVSASHPTEMNLSEEAERSLRKGFLDAQRGMSNMGAAKFEQLLEAHPPKPRLVLRPTQIYQNCLRRSSYPWYLSNPESRQSELRKWLDNGLFPEPLIEREVELLRDFFIPLFQVDFDAEIVNGLEIVSPSDVLKKRISRHLDENRQTQVVRQIRQVFEVHRKEAEPMQKIPSFDYLPPKPSDAAKAKIIEELAESIISCAEDDSFGYSWSNIQRDQEGDWVQTSFSPSLYHGAAGIYLSLNSALRAGARFSSEGAHLLQSLEDQLTDFLLDPPGIFPLGLFEGASGVAYSLLSSGTTEAKATRIISALVKIFEDRADGMSHDIISGAAGVLLFASRLEKFAALAKDARIIQSLMCRRLERLASRTADGIWVWDPNPDWFGGLSHGPAGVMWALRESAYAESFSDLAERALEAQLSLLSVSGFSWKTRRLSESPQICAWCHGSEGLALIFNATMPESNLAKKTINSLLKEELPRDVCLCHGLSGRYLSLYELNLGGAAAEASDLLWRHASTGIDMMKNLDDSLMTGRAGVLLALSHSLASNIVPSPLIVQIQEKR